VDGTRSALIVASDEYNDPGLRQLHAPASDARALAAVLQDPGIGAFEVHTLLNKPAHEVNLVVEEFFADRLPNDLLVVHFSCHGVKGEDGELYFAMTNTLLGRLGATAVGADFVNRCMGRSRSRRVVLLLDCCYAGAFERGMRARADSRVGIKEKLGGRGRAVITASSAMEYAFEGDELTGTSELAPSVFTSALVEGLVTGEADRDQDGLVGLDELYEYVYDKVRAVTPNQTPGKWASVQGELIIAHRACPVSTPAALPRELRELIDSPFAQARVVAVQELECLLFGSHAGLVLAARLALEQLADDDSRSVSAAATASLSTQTQPSVAATIPSPEAVPVASERVGSSSRLEAPPPDVVPVAAPVDVGTAYRDVPCPTCDGTGAAPGTHPRACQSCKGSGRTSQNMDTRTFPEPCDVCQGRGLVVDRLCPECDGSGRVTNWRHGIFLSYRRQAGRRLVERLHDRLIEAFGAEQILTDVVAGSPDEDFGWALASAVDSRRVLLAVIGPDWADARDEEGRRLLEGAHDRVRVEIESGLRHPGVFVIPVLIDGAAMPRAEELPGELAQLSMRQAVKISAAGFARDVEILIDTLQKVLS
jgi:Caspase domain/DnaJ central domain/TIR domain